MNLVLSKCEADDLFSFTVRVAIRAGHGHGMGGQCSCGYVTLSVGIPLDTPTTLGVVIRLKPASPNE